MYLRQNVIKKTMDLKQLLLKLRHTEGPFFTPRLCRTYSINGVTMASPFPVPTMKIRNNSDEKLVYPNKLARIKGINIGKN